MKLNRPYILVLAGVNGAGKSSVLGDILSADKIEFFNPDTFTKALMSAQGIELEEANSEAWKFGVGLLKKAVKDKINYAFETTLGGNTVTDLLIQASKTHDIDILYCGLNTVEMHIERVKFRVKHGGHSIPENKIRERWINSKLNLVKLLKVVTNLRVYDNSFTGQVGEKLPDPLLVLSLVNGALEFPNYLDSEEMKLTPEWAKPIVITAVEQAENN